jgi:hypothetical protein
VLLILRVWMVGWLVATSVSATALTSWETSMVTSPPGFTRGFTLRMMPVLR